ncbi:PLP-dependent aminotransferase family protein [Profundibacter sp.]|uniref:aminotransferase-like domain-containing protein n=1 Tax=Profundibacter sp. TaxID=3101071 RepID=UPI003D13B281
MNTIWFPDLSTGNGPKYLTLTDAIRQAIVSEQLQVGERLPPVRELGWQLKVTPGTVARAYTKLTDEGLLEAAVGRGTFVAEPKAMPQHKPIEIGARPTKVPDRIELLSPLLPDVGQEALIRNCYARMAQMPNDNLIQYPSQATEANARIAIADWLQGVQLGRFEPEDIVLSHGGQNAIMMILQIVLKDLKPMIFAEDLSYAGFRHAARLLRAGVVGLKCDSEGVRPDELEAACRKYGPQVFCTSPEVHNPTTGHTGLTRRKELAEVARRYGCAVLEDDCYHMQGSGLPTYRQLLPELGWYVSSLSKSLTPSLRVGFALAPQGKAQTLRRTAQFNHFGLAITITDLTEMVLQSPDLPQIRTAIVERVNSYVRIAVNVLGRYDLKWRNDVPFLWLKLPRGWRASNFCRAAEKQGIRLRSADDFALLDGRAPHAVRITVNGQIPLEAFERAMYALERLLSNPPDLIEV